MIIALSGGVGGAKLALGLSRILPPEDLLVVANTGDDFEHLGLAISPDIDTVVYTLAGLANPELGWGRARRDLVVHGDAGGDRRRDLVPPGRPRPGDARRTHAAAARRRNPVRDHRRSVPPPRRRRRASLPMSDDPVRTRVAAPTPAGSTSRTISSASRCEPVVRELRFHGAETARPQPDFMAALADPALEAVVICPSNPFISVEPILAVPGVRDALAHCARAGHRGVADHRRPRGEGADRQDDDRTRPGPHRRHGRATLRRFARRLRHRPRRHGRGGVDRRARDAGADADDDAGGSRGCWRGPCWTPPPCCGAASE